MRHTLPLAIASTLGLSLVGCFSDTPQEPTTQASMAGLEFAAVTVGNLTDLGTFGGDEATATGINENGKIVGYMSDAGTRHAMSWQSGTVTDLGTLGGSFPSAIASDINDAGQIVGTSFYQVGEENFGSAFRWENGHMTDLGRLPGGTIAFAAAINSSGKVVGQSENNSCFDRPVLWQNGSVNDLGSLAGGCGGANDINDGGQVVGESDGHAFRWANGTMHDLGTLGGDRSSANGINGSGHIVGNSTTTGGSDHAFRWVNGTMTDLGTLGGSTSSALGINDNGVIVGYSTTASSTSRSPVRHAFVWQNGIMSDLGTLGGDRTMALAINDAGLIVGESNLTKGGRGHAVRWTIPSTDFWSERAALSSARRAHAVGTATGLIYVIGGRNSAGTVLSSVQAYNPGTNSWSPKAPLPAIRHTGNGAATIAGTIYVAGGRDGFGGLSRTLYAYNSSTNTWSTKAAMPVAGGCGGSAVISGKVYVFSGCTLSGGTQVGAGLLHRYDPATNAWATLRPAPAVHSQPVVGATGGKLYVVGGSSATGAALDRLDVYDPATNTWSAKARMPTARAAPGGAMNAGKLYVMGGRNSGATFYRGVVEVYDPANNSWSAKAPMIAERAEFGVGVINNLLYAVGGRNVRALLVLNERYTP